MIVAAGLDPRLRSRTRGKTGDARAFASPKRLRPRRRVKPGMTTIRDFTPDGTGIAQMLRWWQAAELHPV
jgi:hypothetical protein